MDRMDFDKLEVQAQVNYINNEYDKNNTKVIDKDPIPFYYIRN